MKLLPYLLLLALLLSCHPNDKQNAMNAKKYINRELKIGNLFFVDSWQRNNDFVDKNSRWGFQVKLDHADTVVTVYKLWFENDSRRTTKWFVSVSNEDKIVGIKIDD